jgi:SagB-type dehydrogenase family enzyme
MRKMHGIIIILFVASAISIATDGEGGVQVEKQAAPKIFALPEPARDGNISVEQALIQRRSVREFTEKPVELKKLSQLLWASQGVTDSRGLRTAPSAGALYPLELYVLIRDVADLTPGTYKYSPDGHRLKLLNEGDAIEVLLSAALNQSWIAESAAIIVIAGVYDRTKVKYGDRASRYVHIEAGCAAENMYLQAVAEGLGTTLVGAFDDDKIASVIGLEAYEYPLALMPVGYPAK